MPRWTPNGGCAGCCMNELDSMIALDLLYDFYGELLTAHQKRIFEAVMFDDRSVSEVAREEGISRQGVSDLLKRVQEQLKGYEARLGLAQRFRKEQAGLTEIRQLAEDFLKDGDVSRVRKIRELAERIGTGILR